MAAVTICSDFGATVSTVSPSISHEVMGPDAMILVFWMLSFKPTFSLSSFTFLKRLFSSSSLSAIRVVSSAYLRLLIFLLAILIPACAYSSPAFLMMYSAYKLNKQGDNIQPWRTPCPIWSQSVVPCPVLHYWAIICFSQKPPDISIVFWYKCWWGVWRLLITCFLSLKLIIFIRLYPNLDNFCTTFPETQGPFQSVSNCSVQVLCLCELYGWLPLKIYL